MKVGIVGLPNVGKSTLFNALTATAAAQAANYPFCTIEPNVGRVGVPDDRLEILAKLSSSQKIIPTQLEFVDIAGLVRGASKGEGLGNQFLGHIRSVDAILHVLRCFEDDDITPLIGLCNAVGGEGLFDAFSSYTGDSVACSGTFNHKCPPPVGELCIIPCIPTFNPIIKHIILNKNVVIIVFIVKWAILFCAIFIYIYIIC